MVTAEIITIGDEILIGQILDTNSEWLAVKLGEMGVTVHQITSVSDSAGHISEALSRAIQYADVVIITGGLGPTKDDITKRTLSDFFGMPLVRDQEVWEQVGEMMRRRGIDFNESNQGQCLVPQGCRVLKNNNGTAPGMMFQQGKTLIFSLPGVPFEMKALFTEQVSHAIADHFVLQHVIHRTVNLFGIAESVLSELIAPWEDALPKNLHLAYLPNARVIRLRLSAYGVDPSVINTIDSQFADLRTLIKPYYLGDDPMSVEGALSEILVRRHSTLAVAESCTGGAISARITAMSGASTYYKGGICAYSNEAKTRVLNVDSALIAQHGAVSEPVAQAMARGARQLLGTDYAIATTGIAGPDGGTPSKPVGTVCIAVASSQGVSSCTMSFGLIRQQNIERAATHALNMLRLTLI